MRINENIETMRIIKFKGKSLEDRQWNIGDLTHAMNLSFINPGYPRSLRLHTFGVYPSTVCQFTGLLDKNGKEIYDGDVLRSDNFPYRSGDKKHDKYYAVVYYCEKAACFGIVMVKNTSSSSWGVLDGDIDGIDREKMQDFEVIGNIHEEKWQQYGEYFKTEEEKEV